MKQRAEANRSVWGQQMHTNKEGQEKNDFLMLRATKSFHVADILG